MQATADRSAARGLRARPTMYRGVLMRSRMEADLAALLDLHGVEWEYEPMCFADATGQYLPDFYVVAPRFAGYVELKGYPVDVGEITARMEIVWSSEPTADLYLVHLDGDCFASGTDRCWIDVGSLLV